jgi:hypothetical protein
MGMAGHRKTGNLQIGLVLIMYEIETPEANPESRLREAVFDRVPISY